MVHTLISGPFIIEKELKRTEKKKRKKRKQRERKWKNRKKN